MDCLRQSPAASALLTGPSKLTPAPPARRPAARAGCDPADSACRSTGSKQDVFNREVTFFPGECTHGPQAGTEAPARLSAALTCAAGNEGSLAPLKLCALRRALAPRADPACVDTREGSDAVKALAWNITAPGLKVAFAKSSAGSLVVRLKAVWRDHSDFCVDIPAVWTSPVGGLGGKEAGRRGPARMGP
jgi:hypothetical protein